MTETLEATEVKIEDLTKEELVRVLNDKQIEAEHYKNEINHISGANQDLVKQYNKDMTYMSELNGNLVSAFRKKEDAVKAIITGALELLTIDRENIAPERKENE